MFRTKANNELSSNEFNYQKSNARDMLIALKIKFLLIIIRWGNDLRSLIIYEKTKRKNLCYTSKMSSSSWKRYTLSRKRFFLTNDIACNWLWSCNLSKSRIINLQLFWPSVINILRWLYCQILRMKNNLKCWSRFFFITLKIISKRKMRTFFHYTLLRLRSKSM